jgi:predicted outer membrane protein
MKACSCYLAAVVLLAACGSRSSSATAHYDSAGGRDSVAAVAAATMDESAVFGLLDELNAADSAAGSLGAARATATEVRDFGRMITREHHALRKDGIELAHRLGLEPTQPRVPPDAPPPVMEQSLTKNAGPDSVLSSAWDRAYIDYSMAVHNSALENAARALAATRRQEVKDYIGTIVPILQKHLDKAQTLAKLLASRVQPARPRRQ